MTASFTGETGEAPSTVTHRLRHVAAGAAGTATEEVWIDSYPWTGTITGLQMTMDATLTGAATNFRTYTVTNRTTGNVIGQLAFSSAPVVATAFTPLTIPVSNTPANVAVSQGDVITLRTAVTGSGLADVSGLVAITGSRNDVT